MEWNRQQEAALKDVSEWIRTGTSWFYYLAGFAGTGKTTLAQHLAADVKGPVYFAAYTGKAASVMRERGCVGATTLHSLMYSVLDGDREKLLRLKERLAKLPPSAPRWERVELEETIKEEQKRVNKPRFALNPASPLASAALLVLDECSMVNDRMGEELRSFGCKVLVLGDPAQLPPVKGAGYFTERKPNTLLTDVMRQAKDNPIIEWATLAREGRTIPYGINGTCRKLDKERVPMSDLTREGVQLLTGKNETRRKLNQSVRRARGFEGTYPRKGERLVCLKNDHELGVLNGVVCEAADDAIFDEASPDLLALSISYEGRVLAHQDVFTEVFNASYEGRAMSEDLNPHRYLGVLALDYGYALTVHKAQGSLWDSVALCDDGFGKRDAETRRRWLYTAITRAQRELLIVA